MLHAWVVQAGMAGMAEGLEGSSCDRPDPR